jgi:hypothetical protein
MRLVASLLAAVSVAAPAPRPFASLVEAESFNAQHATATYADAAASGGRAIALSAGSWVRFDAVDFGDSKTASGYATWRSCATGAGTIDFRLDSLDATPFLTLQPAGGGCTQWYQSSLRMGLATVPLGVHTFYLSARPGSACGFYHLDSFQLIKQTGVPIP